MPKLIRITTVPVSMQVLLKGQMKFMQQHGFEVTMVSSDGAEVIALEEQECCKHIAVTLTRKISPLTDLVSLVKLIRLFRKLKPDIVHTHTPKAGLLGMWAALLAGVPVRLHTIAGLPWMESTGLLRNILRTAEKLTAMPACMIYPNSLKLQQFLQKQNIARGKMKVLGKGSSNGIDSDFFSITEELLKEGSGLREERNVGTDAWVWIFVGRLVKDKGIGELLDAFVKTQVEFPGDRLWLLGTEEPELDPLEEKHKKILETNTAIQCWGFQHDIRPYLAAAQVLVFPSYREGFPNVPMQAGSMGCMLLLTDINGCNEIVQHNENGLLVPAKNTAELAAAMLYIRRHPQMRDAYASAIQKKIKQDYDQKNLWNLILHEYHFWLSEKKVTR